LLTTAETDLETAVATIAELSTMISEGTATREE